MTSQEIKEHDNILQDSVYDFSMSQCLCIAVWLRGDNGYEPTCFQTIYFFLDVITSHRGIINRSTGGYGKKQIAFSIAKPYFKKVML